MSSKDAALKAFAYASVDFAFALSSVAGTTAVENLYKAANALVEAIEKEERQSLLNDNDNSKPTSS